MSLVSQTLMNPSDDAVATWFGRVLEGPLLFAPGRATPRILYRKDGSNPEGVRMRLQLGGFHTSSLED